MANVNRWVPNRNNSKNTVLIQALSGTTIEMGDLLFLDNTNDLLNGGNSTASNTAFPLNRLRPSGTTLEAKIALLQTRFLGVALDDKDGDSHSPSKMIPIATTGIFEYELKPGGNLNIGDMLGPTGTTTSSNMFNQKVRKTSAVTKAISFSARKTLRSMQCEMTIRTAFSQSNIIS